MSNKQINRLARIAARALRMAMVITVEADHATPWEVCS